MPQGLLIRLQPNTPWRIGPASGDRDRVDRIYHSDAVYSAVSSGMQRLGMLDQWLDATARAPEPAVRLSSCFPFLNRTLYVVPPRNIWPPAATPKVRWKGARFRVRMVLDILCDEDMTLPARMLEGLRLLEDDSLGGGGSRGSGRVRFANLKLTWRNRAFYSSGGAEAELASGPDLGAIQSVVNDSSFTDKLSSEE